MNNKLMTALSIAGTDPTGGAGVSVDMKVFQSRGVYGMGVTTSVIAQNTLGVQQIHHLPLDIIEAQLNSVFDDITPDAIKTGMIATKDMMEVVLPYIQNGDIPYVSDPVMIAKSGDALIEEETVNILVNQLLPNATVVTPNIPEAERITNMKIETLDDIKSCGKRFIEEIGCESVVVKGGHLQGDATDYLFIKGEEMIVLNGERFDTEHTHGTGCTFSSVITSELAKGHTIENAVRIAKAYIEAAIKHTPQLGHGRGPVNHFAYSSNDE